MPTRGSSVFLVTVMEGEYNDPVPMAVGQDEDAAKSWCNEHRKLSGADPIQWKSFPDHTDGSASKYKIELTRKTISVTVFYTIEPMPFIEKP